MPERIQRRRTRGWRMPEGAIYVGRPSRFGNPFDWMTFGRDLAVDFFARWLADDLTAAERESTGIDIGWDAAAARLRLLDALPALRGRDLVCWCAPDVPCHADVLLHIANEDKK